MNIVTLFTGCY